MLFAGSRAESRGSRRKSRRNHLENSLVGYEQQLKVARLQSRPIPRQGCCRRVAGKPREARLAPGSPERLVVALADETRLAYRSSTAGGNACQTRLPNGRRGD